MPENVAPNSSNSSMAFAAGVGGIAQAAVCNPLRVWKNQLQLGQSHEPWTSQMRQVPLLSGMGLFCATTVVSNVWCYTAQQALGGALVTREIRHDVAGVVSGAGAGATEALLTNPLRRVLVMQQTPGGSALGMAPAIRQIVQREGARGLYAGAGVSAVRDGVACGIFFPMAAVLRGPPEQTSPGSDLLAAMFAAAASTAIGQPLDTIISRMQGGSQRVTMVTATRGIMREHGAKGVLRGIFPNIAQAVPGTAAAFVITMALLRDAPSSRTV